MPFIDRSFAPPSLDGVLRNRSWIHPHARLSQIAMRGFLWNPTSGHLPPSPEDDRPYVHIVVEGRGHLLRCGTVLQPGAALVTRSFRATFEDAPLALTGPHRALALRISPRVLHTHARGVLNLPPARVGDLHLELARAGTDVEASAVYRRLMALLVAHGLPVQVDDELPPVGASRRSTADDRIANGLSRALTFENARPALLDLSPVEHAPGERQLRRQLGDFLARFGMPFAGWREMRQSFCLTTAALAMSLPGARTDVVSRATGFSSASSLCHALQRSGIESPQRLSTSAVELRKNL